MSVPRTDTEGTAKNAHGSALLDERDAQKRRARQLDPFANDARYRAKAEGKTAVAPNAFDD